MPKEVLLAARDRDERAVRQVARHYAALVYAVASRWGVPKSAQDDVFQVVIYRGITKLQTTFVIDGRPFYKYLWRITRNAAIDYRRKNKQSYSELDLNTPVSGEIQNAVVLLHGALEALPELQRILFMLVEFDGETLSEAAETLTSMNGFGKRMSVPTLSRHLKQAREHVFVHMGFEARASSTQGKSKAPS